MIYQKQKNKIVVWQTDYFDIAQTLQCGQLFRYEKRGEDYFVWSLDKQARLQMGQEGIVISTNFPDYFINYFDLDTDYKKLNDDLKKLPEVAAAAGFGRGIRLLKQDPFETIISFIISANNNIPRIQKIIQKLCQNFGENQGDFFAFPQPKKLAKIEENEFANLGCGYRARYLTSAAQKLEDGDFIKEIKSLPDEQLKRALQSILGVGNKVADCILLFGFSRSNAFPTDTWIQRLYKEDLGGDDNKNAAQIAQILAQRYGALSGLAQQYLFNYKRNLH